MAEATKDEMRDEGEEQEGVDSFVQIDFTKAHFQTTSSLKDFIVRVTEVAPQYIDFRNKKMQSVLRFKNRVEADYCVKQLLNAKWGQ